MYPEQLQQTESSLWISSSTSVITQEVDSLIWKIGKLYRSPPCLLAGDSCQVRILGVLSSFIFTPFSIVCLPCSWRWVLITDPLKWNLRLPEGKGQLSSTDSQLEPTFLCPVHTTSLSQALPGVMGGDCQDRGTRKRRQNSLTGFKVTTWTFQTFSYFIVLKFQFKCIRLTSGQFVW